MDDLVSNESPQLAAEIEDEFARLLNALPKPEFREIVVLKLEGHTNCEIANQLDRGLSSIERKLKTIRDIWRKANPDF